MVTFLNHVSDILDSSRTLRPIPVLIEDYVNEQGLEVNQGVCVCACDVHECMHA